MKPLNLPQYPLKISEEEGNLYVFDTLRRKKVILTPEEWVRQNFVLYLINDKGFPASLIANEVSLNFNNMKRRCDTVVYNKLLQPIFIIEYKASHISITQSVFDQILRYNSVLRVPFLIVSNGIQHFCCKVNYKTMTVSFLPDIPFFSEYINH